MGKFWFTILQLCLIFFTYIIKRGMTELLILDYLRENGIKISSAQINRMLIKGHDFFSRRERRYLPRSSSWQAVFCLILHLI